MQLSRLRQHFADRLTPLGVVALLALSACHRPRQESGTTRQVFVNLMTSGDTIPRMAYVSIRADDDTAVVALTPSGPGRFVGRIAGTAQRVTLRVVVPWHATMMPHLWLPASGDAEFNIRPRAVLPLTPPEDPSVIGDFNNFNEDTGVPLKGTDHGTLRAAIAFHGDSCRFQILGIVAGARGPYMPVRSWTMAPIAGRQTFAGVIKPVNDSLIFEVDTSRRTPNLRPPSIITVTRDSSLALANEIGAEREDLSYFSQFLQEYWPDRTTYIRTPAIAKAQRALEVSIDTRVRGEALVSILSLAALPSAFLASASQQFFVDIPPGSSLLNDQGGGFALARAFANAEAPVDPAKREEWRRLQASRARAYSLPIARNVTNDSNPRINAYLTLVRALESARDTAGLETAIGEATAVFPKNEGIAMLPRGMGSGQVLRVGAKFPPFRLAGIDDAHEELTDALFAGKLTLVDFWGTWCGACVRELPSMHSAFDAWRNKGFNILSISTDESVDAVKRFRRDKWPMPWIHGWSGAGIFTPALSALGVIAFPTAVLVDGDGRIVAVGGAVRGDSLQLTLARYLH